MPDASGFECLDLFEEQIVASLRETRRLMVCAPTGSGKSTQVPQMLLDRGLLGDGWMLDVGCWMLGVGCWVLGVGCWMLDVRS